MHANYRLRGKFERGVFLKRDFGDGSVDLRKIIYRRYNLWERQFMEKINYSKKSIKKCGKIIIEKIIYEKIFFYK